MCIYCKGDEWSSQGRVDGVLFKWPLVRRVAEGEGGHARTRLGS